MLFAIVFLMLTTIVVHEQYSFYNLKNRYFSIIGKSRSEMGKPIFLTIVIGRYWSANFWRMTSLLAAHDVVTTSWRHEPRCVTLRYATLRYGTLRYATLRYVTLRYGTVRYDVQ